MSEFGDAALQYCKMNLAVIPLRPRDKKPLFENWPEVATSNGETAAKWWDQNPNANVGIVTGRKSNVFVLDVDPKNGGRESWEDLTVKHGRPRDSWQQITGSGGFHIFWRYPAFPVRNVAGLWPGIDIRGDGGQVVAPPSIHPTTGKRYTWDGLLPIEQQELSEAPPWILETLFQKQAPALKARFECPLQIPHGVQHQTLVSLAGALRHMGLSEEEIYACIWEVNRGRCQQPGPEQNIRQIARSMMRYQPGARDVYVTAAKLWRLTRTLEEEQERKRAALTPVDGLTVLRSESTGPKQIIEGMLFNGLTILSGRPKSGKSWFTLQMALSVAYGHAMWGRRKIHSPGRVCYLALEESQSRTSARLNRIVPPGPNAYLQNIEFLYTCPPLFAGGKEHLDAYLGTMNPTVVIIDTLTALIGNRPKQDVFRQDYQEIDSLRKLAERHNTAILVVHHHRKAPGQGIEVVAGSTGVTAAADCIWILTRQPEGVATLDITGREVEDQVFAMQLDLTGDPAGWYLKGEGDEARHSEEQGDILALLAEEAPLRPKAIAARLRKNEATVRRLLQKLYSRGYVARNSDSSYRISANQPD